MKTYYRKFRFDILLAIAAAIFTSNFAEAAQLELKAATGSTKILADKKQTVPLRVALTGFNIHPEKSMRSAVNLAIVLDRSGSMGGDKIIKAREAAILAVNSLHPEDIFSLITYDDEAEIVIPATKVTDKENIIRAINKIDVRGSTALYAGVSRGAKEVEKFLQKGKVNRVILVSDGMANVGPSSPAELGALGASYAKQGISISTIGLGLGYNEDLMTQLAGKSDGNHEFVENSNDLVRIFQKELGDITSVIAKDIKIKVTCPENVRLVRSIGRDTEIFGQTVITNFHELYAKQEKYLILELEMPAAKSDSSLAAAQVEVSYTNMETQTTDNLTSSVSVAFTDSESEVKLSSNPATLEAYFLQTALETNNKAIILRDAGKIAEAKQELLNNTDFLYRNAKEYNLPKLGERAKTVDSQMKDLDSANWSQTRKGMSADVYQYRAQQGAVDKDKSHKDLKKQIDWTK